MDNVKQSSDRLTASRERRASWRAEWLRARDEMAKDIAASLANTYSDLNERGWGGTLPLYQIVIAERDGCAGRVNHQREIIWVSPRANVFGVLVHEMLHVAVHWLNDAAELAKDFAEYGDHGVLFEAECERIAELLEIPLTLDDSLASWPIGKPLS